MRPDGSQRRSTRALHLTDRSAREAALTSFAAKSSATNARRVRSALRLVSRIPPGMSQSCRPAEPMRLLLDRSRDPGRHPSLVPALQASASGIPSFGSGRRSPVNAPVVRVARSSLILTVTCIGRHAPALLFTADRLSRKGQFIRRGRGPPSNEIPASCCTTITLKEQKNTWTPRNLARARLRVNLAPPVAPCRSADALHRREARSRGRRMLRALRDDPHAPRRRRGVTRLGALETRTFHNLGCCEMRDETIA